MTTGIGYTVTILAKVPYEPVGCMATLDYVSDKLGSSIFWKKSNCFPKP